MLTYILLMGISFCLGGIAVAVLLHYGSQDKSCRWY